MQTVNIVLNVREVEYILQVLGAVATGQTVQANMLGLIPNIRDQAQAQLSAPVA